LVFYDFIKAQIDLRKVDIGCTVSVVALACHFCDVHDLIENARITLIGLNVQLILAQLCVVVCGVTVA